MPFLQILSKHTSRFEFEAVFILCMLIFFCISAICLLLRHTSIASSCLFLDSYLLIAYIKHHLCVNRFSSTTASGNCQFRPSSPILTSELFVRRQKHSSPEIVSFCLFCFPFLLFVCLSIFITRADANNYYRNETNIGEIETRRQTNKGGRQRKKTRFQLGLHSLQKVVFFQQNFSTFFTFFILEFNFLKMHFLTLFVRS